MNKEKNKGFEQYQRSDNIYYVNFWIAENIVDILLKLKYILCLSEFQAEVMNGQCCKEAT